jgi:5-methylcytosine-specific restriction endonuclease McrA
MRSLPLPSATTLDVFSICLTAIKDLGLQARLGAIGASLNASTAAYDVGANAETLHAIPRVTSVGTVTKEELIDLYSNHMSATNGAARSVYDQIRNAAPNKKCPLCGIGTVAVLDHHLPKAKYPDLAISPANLVPACHFCNDSKKARFPKKPEEQTLHPYYDARLLGHQWVKAVLDHGPPPALVYSVSPLTSAPALDQKRVERHFKVCGLAVTFTSNANDELVPLKARLAMLESRGGQAAVQAYLSEEALSYAGRLNSWQLAMYQALAADSWFTGGGFHLIP